MSNNHHGQEIKTRGTSLEVKEKEGEVLYQKLGDRWYVFTECTEDEDSDKEIYYAALPPAVDPRVKKVELSQIKLEDHSPKIRARPLDHLEKSPKSSSSRAPRRSRGRVVEENA